MRPLLVKKDLDIPLNTKMLKKLGLHLGFSQKLVHIEMTLIKLNILLLIKDDELLEKYNEKVKIVSKDNLTVNQYTMKNM